VFEGNHSDSAITKTNPMRDIIPSPHAVRNRGELSKSTKSSASGNWPPMITVGMTGNRHKSGTAVNAGHDGRKARPRSARDCRPIRLGKLACKRFLALRKTKDGGVSSLKSCTLEL
jgi:hypothetical protein